jgi:hypothetical protein
MWGDDLVGAGFRGLKDRFSSGSFNWSRSILVIFWNFTLSTRRFNHSSS